MKVPLGGAACPELFAPQHAAKPMVSIPQVWLPPALTAGPLNVAAGGLAWPYMFDPQQAATPLVRTPQLWESPVLIPVKVPRGGAD